MWNISLNVWVYVKNRKRVGEVAGGGMYCEFQNRKSTRFNERGWLIFIVQDPDKKGEEDEYNSIHHGTGAQIKSFFLLFFKKFER